MYLYQKFMFFPLGKKYLIKDSKYSWNISESESLSVMSDSLLPHGLYSPWNSLGHNTGVGSLSLLQEIYPNQGWNPGLPHCRQILYQLSHQWKSVAETWKMLGFLASGGEEFTPGPMRRLDSSELLCDKVLLKYKRDRESFWHRHQKGAERVPPC